MSSHTQPTTFSYASGKIILGGEHAVVYGYPAIALALDRGVRVVVSQQVLEEQGPALRTSGMGGNLYARLGACEGPLVLQKSLQQLMTFFKKDWIHNLEFWVDGQIPVGSGLGSSAALSVGLLRALYRHLGHPFSEAILLNQALELEKVFHGTPSGIDHYTVVKGGCIWFQKMEKEIKCEPILFKQNPQFVVAVSKQKRGTFQIVSDLKNRILKMPQLYQPIFQSMGEIVYEMHKSLQKGDFAYLGELMNINQGLLSALGVSTGELERMCSLARQGGALGAKLTGAGGGGAIIALIGENKADVLRLFEEEGFIAFPVECVKA